MESCSAFTRAGNRPWQHYNSEDRGVRWRHRPQSDIYKRMLGGSDARGGGKGRRGANTTRERTFTTRPSRGARGPCPPPSSRTFWSRACSCPASSAWRCCRSMRPATRTRTARPTTRPSPTRTRNPNHEPPPWTPRARAAPPPPARAAPTWQLQARAVRPRVRRAPVHQRGEHVDDSSGARAPSATW